MKSSFQVNVAVILPTYMEAENIETLIPAIKGVVSGVTANFDVIVIDDDSPDGTTRAAEALGSHVLIRRDERGLGSALRAGIREALNRGADVIITMDADWQHNPQHIPRLINACLEGADIALGSRRIPGGQLEMGLFRGLISLGAKKLSNIALRLGVEDPTSGFRAYNRRAAEEVLASRTDGYAFQADSLRLARKHGLKIVETPTSFNSRIRGVSKLGFSEMMEYIDLLFTLRWVKVLQWSLGIAIIGLLLYNLDILAVFKVLSSLSLFPIIMSIACYACSNLTTAGILKVLLKRFGEDIDYLKTLSWHMSGMLLSDITPARSGYLYILTMPSNKAAIGSAVFLAQGTGFLLKATFALIGIALLAVGAITYIGAAILITISAFLFLFAYGKAPIIGDKFAKMRGYSKKFKGMMPIVVALALMSGLLGALGWYFIALGLGVTSIPLWLYLFLNPVITTLSFIPVSPAGMGVMEVGGTYIFRTLGLDAPTALAFTLLARGLCTLVDLSGGLRIVRRE